MLLQKFSLSDIRIEISRELSMREKVWPRVQGFTDKFIDHKHQRKYDILKELYIMLEFTTEANFAQLREKAQFKASVVQQRMEF